MTTVLFEHNVSAFEITITGHAQYNPGGPDIVCAGCSTLAYTLLQSILAIEEEGACRRLHIDDKSDGFFYLLLECSDWALPRVKTIFDVIIAGFALLQQKYPDYVRLCMRSGEK